MAFAKVVAVVEEPVGTTLAVDASATDTGITVDDVSRLRWPNGGLQIGDEVTYERRVYAVADAPDDDIDVIDADEDEDAAEGNLALFDSDGSTPLALANSYEQDTPVIQFPLVTETWATVQLPDAEEELHLRVPQQLTDRLNTDIRFDVKGITGTSETVELEESDGEWVIADVVSEEGTGFSRAYSTVPGPVAISAVSAVTRDVVTYVDLDIPSSEHRVLLWVVCDNTVANGVFLVCDDGAQDIPLGATEIAGLSFIGVASFGPSMAYQTTTVPTPGLHRFYLGAYVTSGSASLSDIAFWATVI